MDCVLPWALGLMALVAWLVYDEVRFGLDVPPAANGDEPSYDSLGWELAHGRGFQIDMIDAAFRAPYMRAAEQNAMYDLGPGQKGLITSRPPLFPLVLSGLDRLFGRQFWAVRFFNASCLAVICGLMAALLRRIDGRLTACLGAALFVVLDTRTRLYSRTILTEPLAALCVTGLCLILADFVRRPRLFNIAAAGICFALAVLTRSSLSLWAPGLLMLVGWLALRSTTSSAETPLHWRQAGVRFAIFLGTTLAVLAPWMIRNCVVLGEFMPLGAQGAAQLPAGFSDVAWEHSGHWQNLAVRGYFDEVLEPGMSLIEEELAMAKFGKEQARAWVQQHPFKSLALVPLKIGHELFSGSTTQLVLLILAGVGFAGYWRIPELWIGCWLVLLNCVAVGMTWSVDDGRFFVPLIFVEDSLAALGAMQLITFVTGLRFGRPVVHQAASSN